MIKQFTTAFTLLILSISFAHAGKLIPFEDPKTKLYGFKNEKGKVIVSPQFQTVLEPKEDEFLIPVVKDGTCYLMDGTGELKFESYIYDNGWDYYEEGLARFLKAGKVGFHDKKGNIAIQPQYDFANFFEKGISVVCNRSCTYFPLSSAITVWKCGVINNKGELIVPLEHATAEEALKQVETQNHVYEYLKGAELQCEEEQKAEIKRVLNNLLNLPVNELKKKRYKNYRGQPNMWTAHAFIQHYFLPEGRLKLLNADTFYEELADPRVKQVIQGLLEKMS